MKNLIIGLFVLGLTSLSYSQELYSNADLAELEDRSISYVNSNYMNKVQNVRTSGQIKSLEVLISRYDITKSRKFDGKAKPFKVKFYSPKGSIVATYDSKGKILTSLEKFKDIALPKHVLQSISKAYPKAKILSNTYMVSYSSETGAKMNYKVKIRKGDLRKIMKIDADGNFTNYPF